MSSPLSLINLGVRRQLAQRSTGGLEVTLYWTAESNSTTVEIWQPATEEVIAFPVPPDNALDAFNHPFAHLPARAGEPIPLRDLSA